MPPLPESVDCLIVGGGPAGAALAGLLARRGLATALVDDGRARLASPIETLVPGALRALDRCGLGEVVRQAASVDRRQHGAQWDGPAWHGRDDAPGLCLQRTTFDAHLRAWAGAGGAHVLQPAVVAAWTEPSGAQIRHAAGELRLSTRSVVLATGRRGGVRWAPRRVVESGPATASFAFRLPPGASGGGRALVRACADGWVWCIGEDDGGAVAIATVDGEELHRHGLRALVGSLLAEAELRAPWDDAAGARLRAVRATALRCATDAPVLLLGDAAATLDPLASQGTEKALVGAENAAVAIAAALATPADAALAREQHARWEADLFAAHQVAAAGFYARVARYRERPFWAARSRAPVRAGLPAAPAERRLVLAAAVQLRRMLQRVGDRLVPTDGVALGDGPALARVGRVDLAPLVAAFALPCRIGDGIAAAGRDPRLVALGTAAVRVAVQELMTRGILVDAAG